ncbi:MAG TPA: HK97 family phage prohead protease [bacterium]|nr:HK97 family phage prohead protease [bacterium]
MAREKEAREKEQREKGQQTAPTNGNIERRYFTLPEIRAIRGEGDDPDHLEGHAAVFDQLSEDLGGFREKIEKGAFKKTIRKSDVRALLNHDSNFVLGRTKAKTLKLKEDDVGLFTRIDPPDTQWARDLMESIERGDISQMSFGFRTITDHWEIVNKENIRTLKEVELFDVSPVTFPAYPQTDIQARSLLKTYGLDFGAINRVLVSIEHGLDIDDEDRGVIADAVEKLNNLITPAENGNGDTGDGLEPLHQVSILKRKLDLKLKTTTGMEDNSNGQN